MTINIRIVDADEWQGVYVDGALESEHQSLPVMEIVELMKKHKTFNVKEHMTTDLGLAFVEENGFPDRINEFDETHLEK